MPLRGRNRQKKQEPVATAKNAGWSRQMICHALRMTNHFAQSGKTPQPALEIVKTGSEKEGQAFGDLPAEKHSDFDPAAAQRLSSPAARSEERRVGKECM